MCPDLLPIVSHTRNARDPSDLSDINEIDEAMSITNSYHF